jgi:hypothetical protein
MNKLLNAEAKRISRLFIQSKGNGKWNFEIFVNHYPVWYFSYSRHALYEALKAIDCKKGDSVLLPAFICREVLSSINTTGASSVYYDVDRQLQLSTSSNILPSAKAIIAVNYFGFPQNLTPFKQYARKTGAVIIEDNAHGFLGRDEDGHVLGTRGDIGIFSLRKTLMLQNGAAMVMKIPGKNVSMDSLKITKAGVSVPFLVKRFLRKMIPLINFKTIYLMTNITRKMRKIIKDHEILPSDGDAEYRLPVDSMPCRALLSTLAHLDEPNEISRRRELYTIVDSLMRNEGYKPVFPLLPQGVAPYAYPFYSLENKVGIAKNFLKRIGLECFTWPELPDAIRSRAPEHYRTVWMINFL